MYYLVSSSLLDAHYYHATTSYSGTNYPVLYQNSSIRNWLLYTFKSSAFYLGSSYLVNETNSDGYGFETDKVFIPSQNDYGSKYGYTESISTGTATSRQCYVTDWAICNGASFSNFRGYYWTRNYEDSNKKAIIRIGPSGTVDESSSGYPSKLSVTCAYCCARIGIKIRIA